MFEQLGSFTKGFDFIFTETIYFCYRLVNDASARSRFVSNVINFIEKFKFDGLDLDWEYPVCWQVKFIFDTSSLT